MADEAIFELTLEAEVKSAMRFPLQETNDAERMTAATFALMGGLEYVAGTDAATAMAVGKLYVVDMSAWATADRIYSLPTTAAVGERIGVHISAGDASHELQLRTTSASSDTINGTDRSASDWSKLFITGETVVFRCIVANTAWIVEHDGRIKCRCRLYPDTADSVSTAGAFEPILVNTESFDIGDISDTGNNAIKMRRACGVIAVCCAQPLNNVANEESWVTRIMHGTTEINRTGAAFAISGTTGYFSTWGNVDSVADGDSITGEYRAQSTTDVGHSGLSIVNYLSVEEVLV